VAHRKGRGLFDLSQVSFERDLPAFRNHILDKVFFSLAHPVELMGLKHRRVS
jgi:hypothetical protein